MNYRGLRVPDDIATRWKQDAGAAWRRGVDQAINTTTMDDARARDEPVFRTGRKDRDRA